MVTALPETENKREIDDEVSFRHVELEMLMKLLREGVNKAVKSFREYRGRAINLVS